MEEIAHWEVRSNGKSITEARIDILSSADTWEFYGGLAATVVGACWCDCELICGVICRRTHAAGRAQSFRVHSS